MFVSKQMKNSLEIHEVSNRTYVLRKTDGCLVGIKDFPPTEAGDLRQNPEFVNYVVSWLEGDPAR